MRRVVTVFLLLAFGSVAWTAGDDEPASRLWRVGVETNTAPYSFADANNRPDGFAVGLLREIEKTEGLSFDYVLLDRSRLTEALTSGRIDVLSNIADTPERRAYLDFSTTTTVMPGRIFMRKDRSPPKDLSELTGLRIATVRGSRAEEYLRDNPFGLVTEYHNSYLESITALLDNRADAILANESVTVKFLSQNNIAGITAIPLELPGFDYRMHFGLAKNHPELLAKLNEGLAELHRNGNYDQLHEKWLGRLKRPPLRLEDLLPYLLPMLAIAVIILAVLIWQRALLQRVSNQAQAIRENEERLRLVFEGSQDGFWDWEVSAGRILRSPRWAGMLGYTLEEIGPARESFLRLIHPDDRLMMDEDYQLLLKGKDQFHMEFRMRAKSGEWKWIMDRGKVISRHPSTGAPIRITGTHTDITDRKQAEEQADRLEHKMRETQKLESLGVLAGGIAHDFNNLLTVILGNATLARMDAQISPANEERLNNVTTSAQRAAELCHQLLAYAGRASYSTERVNLSDVVTETTRLLEMSIGKQAKLAFSLAENLPLIEADAAQLRQVIMNLVINASESLGSKSGVIEISTCDSKLCSPESNGLAPSDEFVCLCVTDNGAGMTPEVLARIFDPFFTTKFAGRGLGLAAVQGIVRAHRGSLKVESIPGRGSVFRLFLPVASSVKATPAITPAAAVMV
ncbi:transporter substrate-binding domain-containing protein [Oleiharenicola lentus]|uniref:transporter substrate-binding domain-containing protein n=1 Tax=Oleiharenicola lentus TaxID=2508720 RepID=UPI003F66D970